MKELIEIRDELLVGVEKNDLLYIKMQINKIDTLIHRDFEFNSLIDRLERASNLKYPNRKWNAAFKENVKIKWKGSEDILLDRVLELEEEIKEIK